MSNRPSLCATRRTSSQSSREPGLSALIKVRLCNETEPRLIVHVDTTFRCIAAQPGYLDERALSFLSICNWPWRHCNRVEVGETEEQVLGRLRSLEFVDDLEVYEDPIRTYLRRAEEPYDHLKEVIW